MLGELFPVRVTFRNERQEITTSTTFVFALLLMFGPGPAVAAQLLASAIADAKNRKAWWKATFNLGQYALSWIATAIVLVLPSAGRTSSSGRGPSRAPRLWRS